MLATLFWSVLTIFAILGVILLFYLAFAATTIGVAVRKVRKFGEEFSQRAEQGRKIIKKVHSKNIQE